MRPAVGRGAPGGVDQLRLEADVDVQEVGELADPLRVVARPRRPPACEMTSVAGTPSRRVSSIACSIPLRWMIRVGWRMKYSPRRTPRSSARAARVLVRRRGRPVEVHDVGDDLGVEPGPRRQLVRLDRVDDDVAHGRQRRREGGRKVVTHAVDGEPLALPGEVVVVGDDRDAGLRHDLRDREAERDVERDREGVLHQEQVQVEVPDEGVQLVLQVGPQLVDAPRHGVRAHVRGEVVAPADRRVLRVRGDGRRPAPRVRGRVDRVDVRVAVERLRHEAAHLGRPVQLAGEVEAVVAETAQHLGPLGRLERDAVRAGQPRRDDADPAVAVRDHRRSLRRGPVDARRVGERAGRVPDGRIEDDMPRGFVARRSGIESGRRSGEPRGATARASVGRGSERARSGEPGSATRGDRGVRREGDPPGERIGVGRIAPPAAASRSRSERRAHEPARASRDRRAPRPGAPRRRHPARPRNSRRRRRSRRRSSRGRTRPGPGTGRS